MFGDFLMARRPRLVDSICLRKSEIEERLVTGQVAVTGGHPGVCCSSPVVTTTRFRSRRFRCRTNQLELNPVAGRTRLIVQQRKRPVQMPHQKIDRTIAIKVGHRDRSAQIPASQ